MQTTSLLYKNIVSGKHWFESKLEIRDPTANVADLTPDTLIGSYDDSKILALSTSHEIMRQTFEIGKAIAGEIDVKMVNPAEEIPKMAMLIPYVRACNTSQQSEWLMQGVFFVDTRKNTKTPDGVEALVLHGYDAMLKAERMHTSAATRTDIQLINSIARVGMGLNNNGVALVDQRTWDVVTDNYSFTVTPSYAMRDTLRNIASAYGGWFVITEKGYLRLITVSELPKETRYLVTENYDPIVFGAGSNATKILI